MKPEDWTPELLKALETKHLRVLRANAERLKSSVLVERCDAELSGRTPAPKERVGKRIVRASGEFVSEYHFVCERDRGVSFESDGTFWTGSWVVAPEEIARSLRFDAHVALHESKASPSYRQGRLVGSRPMDRKMINKTNLGLALRVQPTDDALPWSGSGAGEKGYRWATPDQEDSIGKQR